MNGVTLLRVGHLLILFAFRYGSAKYFFNIHHKTFLGMRMGIGYLELILNGN